VHALALGAGRLGAGEVRALVEVGRELDALDEVKLGVDLIRYTVVDADSALREEHVHVLCLEIEGMRGTELGNVRVEVIPYA
jgi:hypothetical protein